MGVDESFGAAFLKSQIAAGVTLPDAGVCFISVKSSDKEAVTPIARDLADMGFKLIATRGTAAYLSEHGVNVEVINKVLEGRPHVVDSMTNGDVQLIFNTTEGSQSLVDSASIRQTALSQNIPYYTTLSGARAAVQGIRVLKQRPLEAGALQTYSQ